MASRTRWFLAERFVLLYLKSCNRLCNHLPLGADLVKEGLVLDEQEQDGGGAIDKANISLSIPILTAERQRYNNLNVAGSYSAE